jgi:hypothetical protein
MEEATGFETGGWGEVSNNNGSTMRSDGGHCGTYYARMDAEGDYVTVDFSNQTTLYSRAYFRITAEPVNGATVRVMTIFDQTNTDVATYLKFEKSSGGQKRFCLVEFYPSVRCNYYNYNWLVNTWYCLEVKWVESASGEYRLYLDGSEVITRTGVNTSGLPNAVDRVYFGQLDTTGGWSPNVDVDCIVVSDTGPIGDHDNSLIEGFESLDYSEWDATEGSPEIQALRRHCGLYSMYCYVVSGDNHGPYVNVGHHKEGQVMLEVQFDDMPADGKYYEFFKFTRDSTTIMSLRLRNNSGNYEWGFGYMDDGDLLYTWDNAIQNNPAVDQWHCVKAEIFLSPVDGSGTADYTMTVNDSPLNNANITNVDSDYTGFTDLYAQVITDDTRARVYVDCIEFSTTDLGACHDAGSEDVEDLESFALSECDVDVTRGVGPVQVWVNCEQVECVGFSVTDEARGLGHLILPYSVDIARLDTVHIYAYGKNLLHGEAVSIAEDRGRGAKAVTVQTRTIMLYGRIIEVSTHRSYQGYDVGEVAYDLIDFYFDGYFTANNVDQNIGHTVSSIDLYERSVGTGFEELARRGNAAFYVDDENDVHFFQRGGEDTGYTVEKTDLAGDITVDLVGDVVRKVIVKGDGVYASAGSGLPERIVSDRRITTNEEAQEVATAYLTRYGSQTIVTIPVRGFWLGKNGQKIRLNSPEDGYENEELIVSRITWEFNEGRCLTTITTGDEPPEFDFIFREIQREIMEKEVNRISGHVGTEGGDGDPFAVYTDILDISNAGVALNQNEVQLISGGCDPETDEATAVEIFVGITRNSGEFLRLRVRVNDGASNLYMFYTALFSSWTTIEWVDRRMIAEKLGSHTITVYGDPASTQTGNVDVTLLVRQYTKHAHSTSQGGDHSFD